MRVPRRLRKQWLPERAISDPGKRPDKRSIGTLHRYVPEHVNHGISLPERAMNGAND
jgi:hypothetical protein